MLKVIQKLISNSLFFNVVWCYIHVLISMSTKSGSWKTKILSTTLIKYEKKHCKLIYFVLIQLFLFINYTYSISINIFSDVIFLNTIQIINVKFIWTLNSNVHIKLNILTKLWSHYKIATGQRNICIQ